MLLAPMNLQQFEYVLEIVRQGNHLSAAAEALHTSQPGVSRQIRSLERELGFAIFHRTPNRILGVTEAGAEVLKVAERIMDCLRSLEALKQEVHAADEGELVIATTHTHAKYLLPEIIRDFMAGHPKVRVELRQGDPESICTMVANGLADVAIGTEAAYGDEGFIRFPSFVVTRSVLAPKGHPLLMEENLTLEHLVEYPLITYDARYSAYTKVLGAFQKAGLKPHVILSAMDADVCKAYVRSGFGIAILATVACLQDVDESLDHREVDHLFESSTSYIRVRPTAYIPKYLVDFIGMCTPSLDEEAILKAVKSYQAT